MKVDVLEKELLDFRAGLTYSMPFTDGTLDKYYVMCRP